jgi:peptidoglycan/xylan/chitin deacetylase (PgdA/CDA1 family)
MNDNDPQGSLVVMYHYVWPDSQPVPGGIRPLMASEFEAQLNWLERHYEILTADDFLVAIQSEPRDKPACLLTFDDGTRDHAEVVTPILARRGLSGVFFVLTWPMERKRMPLTHALHWLLGQGEDNIWRSFEQAALKETGSVDVLGDPRAATKIYYYESPLRARIKYAANMAMPHPLAERIINRCIAETGQSVEALAEQWFITSKHIQHMQQAGMTIGLHGCSHRSLQALGADGIRNEIHHAWQYVCSLTGQTPGWYACPFGGSGASDEEISAMHGAMREHGIRASVTTQKQLVPPRCDPWQLPRYDAIDLPPRKAFFAADAGIEKVGRS